MTDDLIEYGHEASELPDGVIGTSASKMAEAKKTTKVKSNLRNKKSVYAPVPGGNREEICEFFKARNGEVGSHDFEVRYTTDGAAEQVNEVVFWGESTITMPKWSALSKQSKEVQADWKNMYKILYKHELRHRRIFRKTFEEEIHRIQKMVHKIRRKLSEQEIKREKDNVQIKCQSTSDQYDTDSGHGANEGLELKMCLSV